MLFAVLALCGLLWASNFAFFNFSNGGNLLRYIAMLGILSVGMSFVIVTGGIDLSVGTLVGLTGVIIAKLSSHSEGCFGWSLWTGIPIAMAVVLAIGLFQGLMITRLNLQPFIVTLAGLMIFRGISQTICESGALSLGFHSPLKDLANSGPWVNAAHHAALIKWPVIIFAGVLIVFGYLLHFSVFGRYVFAIGGNREAAKYSGINVRKVETLTYVISAGLAGLAGICYAGFVGDMDKTVGQSYELYAITACVLGGCSLRGGEGSVFGVFVGSAMYFVIYNGINMFQWPLELLVATHKGVAIERWKIPTEWTEWIVGGVLLIAVATDQITHIIQAKRRTRRVTEAAPSATKPTPAPASA
jgi:ribose transport system permease protein